MRASPPKLRGRAAGAWATGFLLGNVAGPVIGGGLIVGSLRTPFLVYAGMLVITGLVAAGLLHGRVGGRPIPNRPTGTTVTFAAAFRALRSELR
jgi:DHA1 family tetracycline resistance protein-like MFS transporter